MMLSVQPMQKEQQPGTVPQVENVYFWQIYNTAH